MHEMKYEVILIILEQKVVRIKVVVEKIWQKEFQGLILIFWKVARAVFGNIFIFQGLCL
jgi:hypothetical protein